MYLRERKGEKLSAMAQKSTIGLELGTRQYLSQVQIQLARVLEMSAPEFEERVERELEENPALEVRIDEHSDISAQEEYTESEEKLRKSDYADPDDVPVFRMTSSGKGTDDDDSWQRVVADTSESMYDTLLTQLSERKLPEQVALTARYIIGNLDSNGYLRRSESGIKDDILFQDGVQIDDETYRRALDEVQSLEPYGLGAKDLQETLLIQLRRLPESEVRDDAIRIIADTFEAFSMIHTHRIVSELHLSAARVERAVELIRTLNPKPGAALGTGPGENAAPIIPDFYVNVDEGELTVGVNNLYPELRISSSFETAVGDMKRNAEQRKRSPGSDYLLRNYRDARDFINLMCLRQTTLYSVMTAIVNHQKAYFLSEDIHDLRPMGIKDIAAATGYDLSVVSRATAGKYVALPWGIFPLRFFFSDSLGDDSTGGVYTAKGVQDELQRLIEGEDKRRPLSDERITELLCEAGYDVSRRTVAKYRNRLEIPVARLRKKF